MGMEEETRRFFILIANSIALIVLWMLANVLFGIYWGYGFFEGSPSWKNILYYILSLILLAFVIRHLVRKWKGFE
ncbi:MAG TPA: hypothetical protein PK504_04715 [Ferruginibacter sp.]|nr:hypothetical protein [Ferruginibacter sp.]HRE63578.1 hypothetical protein [Ferruginibacter sp.]